MTIFCKAQKEYPLNTSISDIPVGSYIKDYNNELNSYTGTYKATFNTNEITIVITKEIKRLMDFDPNFKFYKDALIVRYTVKNSSGIVLQTTQTTNSPKNFISDISFNNALNSLMFYYNGTNCGVGWGKIHLKKLSSSQISWTYYPNDTTLTAATCQGNPDLTIYLPETENLIFTKK